MWEAVSDGRYQRYQHGPSPCGARLPYSLLLGHV